MGAHVSNFQNLNAMYLIGFLVLSLLAQVVTAEVLPQDRMLRLHELWAKESNPMPLEGVLRSKVNVAAVEAIIIESETKVILSDIAGWKGLTYLEIRHRTITPEEWSIVLSLPGLRKLVVWDCQVPPRNQWRLPKESGIQGIATPGNAQIIRDFVATGTPFDQLSQFGMPGSDANDDDVLGLFVGRTITSLDLSECMQIRSKVVQNAIVDVKEQLWLDGLNVNALALKSIDATRVKLSYLSLASASIDDDILGLISAMDSLQGLNLWTIGARSKATDSGLLRLCRLPRLECLILPDSGTYSSAAIKSLCTSSMEFLALGPKTLGSAERFEVLASEFKGRALRLNINPNLVSAEAVKSLARCKTLKMVDVLLNDVGNEHIAAIIGNRGLTHLFVTAVGIDDSSLSSIEQLLDLETFELSCESLVTDRLLQSLAKLTKLKRVALYNIPSVTDKGVRSLLGLKSLESLVIGNNKAISPQSLGDAAPIVVRRLTLVRLANFGKAAVRELSARIPQTVIDIID